MSKAEISINWKLWDEISYEEYANSNWRDTLYINDRGHEYYYRHIEARPKEMEK